jgi:hypothetical protein
MSKRTLAVAFGAAPLVAMLPRHVEIAVRERDREPTPRTPTVVWMVEHPAARSYTIETCVQEPKRMQDFASWCDIANRAAEVINTLK